MLNATSLPVIDETERLGAILLALVSDWDAWVSRRVDSFHFAGDDERVLHRRQSIDFALPSFLLNGGPAEHEFGGLPVPLTIVSKWRLPEFSLRDATDGSVSLMGRRGSGRLGAAMLSSLASYVMTGGSSLIAAPDDACGRIPVGLHAELATLVNADPATGLRLCGEFQDLRAYREAGSVERAWREKLARSELFMSLAYELSVGFPLIALVQRKPERTRYLLKLSYNSYVVPAEHDRLPVRLRHVGRWLRNGSRDAVDMVEWPMASSRRRRDHQPPDPGATGGLRLSTSCRKAAVRLHHGGSLLSCGLARIRGPGGTSRAVRIRPSGVVSVDGLPPGDYELELTGEGGFALSPSTFAWTARAGAIERLAVVASRERFARHALRAPPAIAAPAWLPKRVSRGVSWSSKPFAIRVRFGDGGSYHCEFEAPPGLHVSRAKLISNLDGNDERGHREDPGGPRNRARHVETVLESTQRVALYSPAGTADAGAGYAFINLRPRAETVVRPAFFTAVVTLVIVTALAINWNGGAGFGGDEPGMFERLLNAIRGVETSSSDRPSWGLLAVLLGAPSALAAYFAQAVPSRVTNAMLYGLRLAALLPVLLSLLIAGALISSPSLGTDLLLQGVVALAAAVCVALGISYRFAEHPPEQKPVAYRQGSDFEPVHLGASESTCAVGEVLPAADRRQGEGCDPEEIRDRMLERMAGMTALTQRKLLGQRWFDRWEREVPPALYFDSAECPAVYLGLRTAGERGELKSLVEDLLDNTVLCHESRA